jgi:hypothetical protein
MALAVAPFTAFAAPYTVLTESITIKKDLTISIENGYPIASDGKTKYSLEPYSVIKMDKYYPTITLLNTTPVTIAGISSATHDIYVKGSNATLYIIGTRSAAVNADYFIVSGSKLNIYAQGKDYGFKLDKGFKIKGAGSVVNARGGIVDVESGGYVYLTNNSTLVADSGTTANVRAKKYITLYKSSTLKADSGSAQVAVQSGTYTDVHSGSFLYAKGITYGVYAATHSYLGSKATVNVWGGDSGIVANSNHVRIASSSNVTAFGNASDGIRAKTYVYSSGGSVVNTTGYINGINVTSGYVRAYSKSKITAVGGQSAGIVAKKYVSSRCGSVINTTGKVYGLKTDDYVRAQTSGSSVIATGENYGIYAGTNSNDAVLAKSTGFVEAVGTGQNGKGIYVAAGNVYSDISGYITGQGNLEGIETVKGYIKAICKGTIVGKTTGLSRGALAVRAGGGKKIYAYANSLVHEIYLNSGIALNTTTPFMLNQVYAQLQLNIKALANYGWTLTGSGVKVSNNGLLSTTAVAAGTPLEAARKTNVSAEPVYVDGKGGTHKISFGGTNTSAQLKVTIQFYNDDEFGQPIASYNYGTVAFGTVISLTQDQLNMHRQVGYRDGAQVGGDTTVVSDNTVIKVLYEKVQLQTVRIIHNLETAVDSGEYSVVSSLTQKLSVLDGTTVAGWDYVNTTATSLRGAEVASVEPDILFVVDNTENDDEVNVINIYYNKIEP